MACALLQPPGKETNACGQLRRPRTQRCKGGVLDRPVGRGNASGLRASGQEEALVGRSVCGEITSGLPQKAHTLGKETDARGQL